MENKTAAIVIAAMCFIALLLPTETAGWGSLAHPGSLFMYQFSHANILHLAINLYALWKFAPRLSTSVVAVLAATISALVYSLLCDAVCAYGSIYNALFPPACGLSAFLCACFARRYVAYRIPTFRFFFWNSMFIPLGCCLYLIPFLHLNIISLFAWHIHLIAFYLSYFIWKVIYAKRALQ